MAEAKSGVKEWSDKAAIGKAMVNLKKRRIIL
jgi:hypothetical protein